MTIDAYLTTSINGMIAQLNGDTPWSDATWQSYAKLARKYPAVIVGKATYGIIQASSPDEFEKLGDPRVLVISRRLKKTGSAMHRVVPGPQSALAVLKRLHIKRALVIGGSKTLSLFLQADAIDKLIVDIEPQIFGEGIPLVDLPASWKRIYASVRISQPSSKVARVTYSKAA